jgi:hypothetical protein
MEIDVPAEGEGVGAAAEELDEVVVHRSGRVRCQLRTNVGLKLEKAAIRTVQPDDSLQPTVESLIVAGRETVRTSIAAVFAVILISTAAVAQSPTPDELLQRGKDNFRGGHYNEAVSDLKAASEAYLAPEQKQQYVATGHLPSLPKLEEAFIYLTMAYNRLGREEDARDTIARLLTAERIEPIYTKLQLEADAAEFERLAADLAPQMRVPANEQLARGGAPIAPAPATQVAEATRPPATDFVPPAPAPIPPATPATSTPTPAAPAPAPTQVATAEPNTPALPVQPTMAQERAEIMRLIDERVAEARKQIEQAAEQRIAAERAAAQKAADERVAAAQQAAQQAAERRIADERASAQQAAEQRIASERAAAQQAAEQRIATERAAAQQSADQRIAAERAAAQKAADERIAAAQQAAEQRIANERAAAERAAAERVAAAEAEARRNVLTSLRQAESFATADQLSRANEIYNRLVDAPNVSRDALAAVATGLYRTGDFRGAVRAFQKLGTFAKGEEDLRYYNAVALYETGQYDQAKKELACALPFIQVTNDVSRYRAKIEQTPSRQAMK